MSPKARYAAAVKRKEKAAKAWRKSLAAISSAKTDRGMHGAQKRSHAAWKKFKEADDAAIEARRTALGY